MKAHVLAVRFLLTVQGRVIGANVMLYFTFRVAFFPPFLCSFDMGCIDESRHKKGAVLHEPQGTWHGSSEESSVRVHRVSNF